MTTASVRREKWKSFWKIKRSEAEALELCQMEKTLKVRRSKVVLKMHEAAANQGNGNIKTEESEIMLSQAIKMHADGNVLPSSFSIIAKNGKATKFFLTPGARSHKPDNPALTPQIRCALTVLADLTEYNNLGGTPGHQLSLMIERGDEHLLEHDARLRELVDARRAQLRHWLDTPPTKLTCKHRKAAKVCLDNISEL